MDESGQSLDCIKSNFFILHEISPIYDGMDNCMAVCGNMDQYQQTIHSWNSNRLDLYCDSDRFKKGVMVAEPCIDSMEFP